MIPFLFAMPCRMRPGMTGRALFFEQLDIRRAGLGQLRARAGRYGDGNHY